MRKLILTASGGPFRGRTRDELAHVTVEDALKHPTWDMGAKITIDSSTLMNKGLEVIEAHELFDVDYDQVGVVVHPQSVIHGMVEFCDGAVIAQLSMPDMRLPIGLALGAPARLDEPFGPIDWSTLGSLTFETPTSRPSPAWPWPTRPADRRRGAGGALRRQRGGRGRLPRPADPLGSRSPTSTARCCGAVGGGSAGNVRDVAGRSGSRRDSRERARDVVERLGKAA